MKTRLLILTLLVPFFSVRAQNNLSGSERKSPFVYAWRISDKEALYLYQHNMKNWEKNNLHSLTDSFPSDQTQDPTLPPGNYLFVQARGSYLDVRLRTMGPLRYDLLNNGQYAALLLHEPGGTGIGDAGVYVRRRPVAYDPLTASYPLGRWKKSRPVKVLYHGALYFFPVTHSGTTYHPHPRWWRGSRHSFSNNKAYENRFHSFLIFSKPKYKPGDTVQGKAFVMDRAGRPVDRTMVLRISDRNLSTDTILTDVRPYRPGGYSFSFVLDDSLGLRLDDDYQVTLEEESSRKAKHDDDDDDDKTAARRKVVSRGTFTYEEYDLKSIQFHARADRTEHGPGEPVSVFLQATDENDLPVADGRVEIQVVTHHQAEQFQSDKVYIPDILWTWTRPLDPVGETRIILPDSIFPRASFSYSIICSFLNSNNELHEMTLSQYWLGDTGRIFFLQHQDSLDIGYRVAGQLREKPAVVYLVTQNGGTIETRSLSLPVSLPINAYANRYVVRVKEQGDSITGSHTVSEAPPLSFDYRRTRDSIHAYIQNPWAIHFWYTLSAGGRVLREGFTDQLDYRARTVSDKPYSLRLQYVWEGKVNRQDYTAPFREKLLQMVIKEPSFVYPGQKATITIGVRDADGRPVPDADLTAWSMTSKFTEFRYPAVPYLGKRFRYRRSYDYTKPLEQPDPQAATPLNWGRWSRELGLDTIEYYKFLNPATVYINREPVRDGVTQIAPFVSRKGQLQSVELLYIDEKLVFFSQAQQVQRYSFPVAPGRHSLRIRLSDKEIRLDSVRAELWMKTFVCINDDTANKVIRFIKMPDTLTRSEKMLLNNSMLLLENSFARNFTTVDQGPSRLYLLNAPGSHTGNYGFLVGPLTDQGAQLRVEDSFEQSFEPEGGYLFHIQPGLIREKQWPGYYPFHSLGLDRTDRELRDRALTRDSINRLWQDYVDERSATQDLYQNEPVTSSQGASLFIGGTKDTGGRELFVKKIFLFRYDDPDYMRIYKGIDRNLGYIEPGNYRLVLLLKGGAYLLRDSVGIRSNGLNYYGFGAVPVSAADSFSRRIDSLLRKMERQKTIPESPEASIMRFAFNEYNTSLFHFGHLVTGRVMDESGKPLTGATVQLKDTRRAVVTDEKGFFHLDVPGRGTLVFAFIGYSTQEKKISPGMFYEVRLAPLSQALNEVVVIGYGIQRKREMTGSVVTINSYSLDETVPLMGRVAGLVVTQPKDAEALMQMQEDTLDIPSLGVPMTGSTLRRHFRDAAFWQPQLRTDAGGLASFNVQYPDDITNWRTYAVAVTAHRQSGMAQGNVRAFKPLSANLSLPAFLVTGDEARVIGKVLNYTPDTVSVVRTFSVNDTTVTDSRISLLNARIDTFTVHPETTDSLHFLYSLKDDKGYTDGEERLVPVFPAGVKETHGFFLPMEGDTSVRLKFDPALGPVHVYASASLLPVLLDEIEALRSYEYLCNEQLASKLMALLQKKKIDRLLQKDFGEEADVNELITRLLKARRGGALWGWWPEAAPSAWVSLHVTEALLMAQKEGYTVALDKQAITDYLVNRMENDPSARDGLFRVRLLQQLQAHVDYSKYIDSLEKILKIKSLYETLKLQELRQSAGLPTQLDTLVGKRRYTALGNYYWGEDSLVFFDNAIQNTVLMYRLLRRAGGYPDLLKKMRDYLLEKRGQGHWRNTYESSLILETLLPELLEGGQGLQPSALRINGQAITAFPYKGQQPAGQPIEVSESGKLPVYFTAYQQFLNKAPEKVNGTFAVRSWFEKDGVVTDRLRAGVPVRLEVEVEVMGDADYVMVEVPIPAGCTYQDKEQQYGNQEVHREYFKNKLSIFSIGLGKGKHWFTVSLLPRYTGVYHLNPARAEMMYFPVLYGLEGMKTVRIE